MHPPSGDTESHTGLSTLCPSPTPHPHQPPPYLALITNSCQKAQHHLHVINGGAPNQEIPCQTQKQGLHCVQLVGSQGVLPLCAGGFQGAHPWGGRAKGMMGGQGMGR